MRDDILFYFKRHPCSGGLDEDAIHQIADELELVTVEDDEVVEHPEELNKWVYFVARGRLKGSIYNNKGREVERFITAKNGIHGFLSAAQGEPVPIRIVAQEASVLLRLDFQKALDLVGRYPGFLVNLLRYTGRGLRTIATKEKFQDQPSVVLVVNQRPQPRQVSSSLLMRLTEIEKSPCVFTDNPNWVEIPGVRHRYFYEEDRSFNLPALRKQIEEWSDVGRIFIDVDASMDFELLCGAFRLADDVLWCLSPEDSHLVLDKIRTLHSKSPRWMEKTNLVWILNRDEQVPPYVSDLNELVEFDFKVSFSNSPENWGSLLNTGIERIVHHLRGVKIGLALGGGAARGMAHLGVLKALEQQGIVVDMIAGTSAGALTGTIYSSGLEVDYSVDCFVNDLTPSWLLKRVPRGGYWYLLSKYRLGRFDPMLRNYLFDWRLEQLPLPMLTVAVDLMSGEAIVRNQGDAVESILESMNLPVLNLPIFGPDRALVDGGLVNNIPANVLVEKECNFVIASTVTAQLEKWFTHNPKTSKRNKQKTPSTLQTVLRTTWSKITI